MNDNSGGVGLKSLSDRLFALEKNIIVASSSIKEIDAQNFLSKLKSATSQSTQAKQAEQMDLIQSHFQTGMSETLKSTHTNMFTYIVDYTVNYIENNIGMIAQVLGSDITSNMKLQTAVTFISEYVSGFDKEMIVNSVNHLVDLLFNKKAPSNINTSTLSLVKPIVITKKNNTISKKFGKILCRTDNKKN